MDQYYCWCINEYSWWLDYGSAKCAITEIVSEKGRIDIVVINADYGLVGALEDASMEEIKSQFETNLFGLIRVTQAALPIMRRKSGV